MRLPARHLDPRDRNIHFAHEPFGLFIDVPWSAWPGHEDCSDMYRGIVWDSNDKTKYFTIRFLPTD